MTAQNQPVYLRLTIRDADNNEIFFSNENESLQPVEVTPGQSQIFPRIEELLPSMQVGERKNLTLKKEDAFGDIIKEAVQIIPVSNLPEHLREPGAKVSAPTENNQTINGTVVAVNQDNVEIDFNHPLAGKTIEVDFVVVEKPF
ncbi:FKBP-type peptidyl-prolyl cis-trans isomerase [Legionella spiritensis]|uniref:FKBP-type peptidyl-prolyl cis-trans isomerase n=1 Tax=Legionella spiritensis TaxID=452 RepID=UPI000F6FF8F9|nr:FKBP-type peptidyl-prolyl cis-trans isomerase [Legionella spiritensis]VEG89880.1 FKBP-type peptidyl-prolyl cis-trans isomerase slyD [Legionella spiritensis]